MSISFTSIDKVARKVTLDVSGVSVTRGIPAKFSGTIDEYISALAKGLEIEEAEESIEETLIETPKAVSGEVIIASSSLL